jgi:NAD(P)H-dependent FMN reductase
MTNRRKIIAISGSTRERSSNQELINAIQSLYVDKVEVNAFYELANLPHFNPDLDTGTPPEAVMHFRRQIKEADGVLICTPEYAMGVPGSLKNAIDWTVSSGEFSHKPVALITASSSGHNGHASLLETLKVIQAAIPEEAQLVISFVKTKVKDSEIIDNVTLEQVQQVLHALMKTIDAKAE